MLNNKSYKVVDFMAQTKNHIIGKCKNNKNEIYFIAERFPYSLKCIALIKNEDEAWKSFNNISLWDDDDE